MNVLLLEDNEEFSRILIELLSAQGYAVSCFNNAADAAKAFERERFGLIITDIHLQGKDTWVSGSGLDFIKHIRKVSTIPIIVTTGLELIAKESVLRRGADHFEYKGAGFDFAKFVEKVKELCPLPS